MLRVHGPELLHFIFTLACSDSAIHNFKETLTWLNDAPRFYILFDGYRIGWPPPMHLKIPQPHATRMCLSSRSAESENPSNLSGSRAYGFGKGVFLKNTIWPHLLPTPYVFAAHMHFVLFVFLCSWQCFRLCIHDTSPFLIYSLLETHPLPSYITITISFCNIKMLDSERFNCVLSNTVMMVLHSAMCI